MIKSTLIQKEIMLQGGYTRNEATEAETFVGASNGETLTKAPQKVPGGLLDLVKCNEIKGEGLLEKAARLACEWTFESTLTGVNATTELAKPATSIGINTNNLPNEEGTTLSLPLKVKLENPLLGGECYVGSEASPVMLNLTSGTTAPPKPNEPISGSAGVLHFYEEGKFLEFEGFKLVDNSFAAPEATGCGGIFAFLIDPLIDSKLGLPSKAGQNSASQKGNVAIALSKTVVESEK